MKVAKLTLDKGNALALALVDPRHLEGRYFLVARPDDVSSYMLVPGVDGRGTYEAMTGYDARRKQWVTLCRGRDEAIVMLGGTTAPLV